MRRKGFTLVELLVVIAIIALLMSILMPALAQVRRLAQRMMCGTNLKGLGNACHAYANDNDDELPRAGREKSYWGASTPTPNWTRPYANNVWPNNPRPDGNPATIGSCWYLLIKYADVTPKQFVCGGDRLCTVFALAEHVSTTSNVTELTKVWDFGSPDETTYCCPDDPGIHYSYSYHDPFEHSWQVQGGAATHSYPLRASGNPASVIAADRSPYLDKDGLEYAEGGKDSSERAAAWRQVDNNYVILDPDGTLNTAAHQREGQNVLYLDAHREFQTLPNCGIEKDNIYKPWSRPNLGSSPEDLGDKELGRDSEYGAWIGQDIVSQEPDAIGPVNIMDTFLISELNYDKP